jgi:hypothetical protein
VVSLAKPSRYRLRSKKEEAGLQSRRRRMKRKRRKS